MESARAEQHHAEIAINARLEVVNGTLSRISLDGDITGDATEEDVHRMIVDTERQILELLPLIKKGA